MTITNLTDEEKSSVISDLNRSLKLYTAIKQASLGSYYTESGKTLDTAVDKLFKAEPKETYEAFENTRDLLCAHYGKTMTLYRARTKAKPKLTINMTSSIENAKQYGDTIDTYIVPIERILAIHLTPNFNYEEFIVLDDIIIEGAG